MTAEDWNKKYSIGQSVTLTNDFGDTEQTETTSVAWDLCGTPVVKVKGRSGGYELNKIEAN